MPSLICDHVERQRARFGSVGLPLHRASRGPDQRVGKLGVKRALNAGAQVEVFGLGCKSQLYKMKSNPVRVKLSCGSLRHRNGAPAISGLFFKPLQGCMGAEKLEHRVESEHKRDATRKGKDGEKQTTKYTGQLRKECPMTGQIRSGSTPPPRRRAFSSFARGERLFVELRHPVEDTPRGRSEILNLEQEVNSLGVENERKHQCQAEALLRPVPRTASGRLHISRCPSASSSQSSDVSHSFLYTGLPPCLLCRWLPLNVCASRHDHSPAASTNDLKFSRPDSVRAVSQSTSC
jgi:hypothetical protein